MARKSETPERVTFSILASKYQSAPEWFEQNLPEISDIMRRVIRSPQSSPTPFGLTEREREFHREAFCHIWHMDKLTSEHATKGLEHCAALIRDDSLPEDVGFDTLVSIFQECLWQISWVLQGEHSHSRRWREQREANLPYSVGAWCRLES